MTTQRILHNWPEKLVSIIVATVIWVYATLGVNSVVTFPGDITVEFRNTASDLVAMTDQDGISIKIKSDSVNLKRITSDNFKAYVDLAGLSTGVYEKDVVVESKNEQIQIVDKNPKKITVRVERMAIKKVPIKVIFSSKAADGYSAMEKSTFPDEVQASGPESEIAQLAEASATIKLAGEDKDFQKNVELEAKTADGDRLANITFDPPAVNVSVVISNATTTKSVAIKAVTTGEVANGFQISDIKYDPSFLTITGPTDLIAGIRFIETKPMSISGLKESATLSSALNLPLGVVLEDKIIQVKVTLTVLSADAYRKIIVKVRPINVEQGQSISLGQDTVEITLRGPGDALNTLNPDDYQAEVDVSGIRNSSISVPIKPPLGLPDMLEFTSSSPSAISVSLKSL